MTPTVAIAGAGVAGLTCGVVLREAGFDVTLFAREIETTTSSVAAAIWYPYHVEPRHKVERWARASYRVFETLARRRGTGVSMVDFDVDGVPMAVPFIETPIYLPWLRGKLRVRRKTIRDLGALDADVVVNCTGLGARELCGDRALRPGRGVVLRTRNPGIVRHAVIMDPLTYVLTRAGDIVLGGTDDEVESRDVPRALAAAIYARCKAVEPRLPRAYAVDVGFRPLRDAVRLEREGNVIHNYGHGGAGFTVSWGCARDVLRLTRSAVRRRSRPASRRRR